MHVLLGRREREEAARKEKELRLQADRELEDIYALPGLRTNDFVVGSCFVFSLLARACQTH